MLFTRKLSIKKILIFMCTIFGVMLISGLNNLFASGDDENLDMSILYHYIDGDYDFLLMKHGEDLPQKELNGKIYYEVEYPGYSIYYWLSENNWIIDKISVILTNKDVMMDSEYLGHGRPMRFMGIWLGMDLAEAKRNVTNIPKWNPDNYDLTVKYYDVDNDGLVDKIDVISNKALMVSEHKEDFYLKWMGEPVEPKLDYLGSGSWKSSEPIHNASKNFYSYVITCGPDSWAKKYYYDNSGNIIKMEILIVKNQSFRATVPSLLGIKLYSNVGSVPKDFSVSEYRLKSQKMKKKRDNSFEAFYTITKNQDGEEKKYELKISGQDEIIHSVSIGEYCNAFFQFLRRMF